MIDNYKQLYRLAEASGQGAEVAQSSRAEPKSSIFRNGGQPADDRQERRGVPARNQAAGAGAAGPAERDEPAATHALQLQQGRENDEADAQDQRGAHPVHRKGKRHAQAQTGRPEAGQPRPPEDRPGPRRRDRHPRRQEARHPRAGLGRQPVRRPRRALRRPGLDRHRGGAQDQLRPERPRPGQAAATGQAAVGGLAVVREQSHGGQLEALQAPAEPHREGEAELAVQAQTRGGNRGEHQGPFAPRARDDDGQEEVGRQRAAGVRGQEAAQLQERLGAEPGGGAGRRGAGEGQAVPEVQNPEPGHIRDLREEQDRNAHPDHGPAGRLRALALGVLRGEVRAHLGAATGARDRET